MTETAPHQTGAIPISSGKMVRFIANVPMEVALQSVDGIRVEGRYGDRVKYTLTDDRTMYVAHSLLNGSKNWKSSRARYSRSASAKRKGAIVKPFTGRLNVVMRKPSSSGIFVILLSELTIRTLRQRQSLFHLQSPHSRHRFLLWSPSMS